MYKRQVHDESRCVMGEDSCFGDIDEAYLSDKNPKVCLENLIQAKKEDNTIVDVYKRQGSWCCIC